MRIRLLALLLAIPVLLATVATTTAAAAPPLTWTSCFEDRAQCASLPVPIDHDEPDGEKITIAIAKLPATDPAARRGTLIYHLGGPSAMLTDESFTAEHLAPLSELRQWFDVVTFDSRGYGKSNRICQESLAPRFALDGTGSGFDRDLQGAQVYGESCRTDNPAGEMPSPGTTCEAVPVPTVR